MKENSYKKASIAATKVLAFLSDERQLEKLDKAKFEKRPELFDLGRDCFFNPELMQELDEEILNDKNFLNGYNHGKRLALIEELQGKNGKKK